MSKEFKPKRIEPVLGMFVGRTVEPCTRTPGGIFLPRGSAPLRQYPVLRVISVGPVCVTLDENTGEWHPVPNESDPNFTKPPVENDVVVVRSAEQVIIVLGEPLFICEFEDILSYLYDDDIWDAPKEPDAREGKLGA